MLFLIFYYKAEAFASFDDAQPLWWSLVKGEEQITIQLQGPADTTMTQRFSLERMDTLFTDVPPFSLNEAEGVDPYSPAAVAVNESDALLVLDTIGNTKDLDFLNVLTEKLEVGPSAMRRHAAKALAKLPAAHAIPELLAQLEKETDTNVSTTLVAALNETEASSPQVLSTLEQRLPSVTTKERVAIVDLLGQHKSELAQQVLVQQFKCETNVRIHQQIGRYVDADALR